MEISFTIPAWLAWTVIALLGVNALLDIAKFGMDAYARHLRRRLESQND